MIIGGLILLIVGWVLLFLEVIKVLPSSIALSLLAHGLSFVGMVTGLIGIIQHPGIGRRG